MMGEENNRYPRFFSSHESEETRDYTCDMVLCCYCGLDFPRSNGMQFIIIERKGKRKNLFRCPKSKQEMQTYKPSDLLIIS
jgi:hypothetical protein